MCNAFGSGNLTEIKDLEDMEYTLNIFKNLKDHCENVWTPLTDEEVEGRYKSAIAGDFLSYLPWGDLQPNGKEEQNYIAIHIPSLSYGDYSMLFQPGCVACDLFTNTELYLTGVCEQTYLGKC